MFVCFVYFLVMCLFVICLFVCLFVFISFLFIYLLLLFKKKLTVAIFLCLVILSFVALCVWLPVHRIFLSNNVLILRTKFNSLDNQISVVRTTNPICNRCFIPPV